MDARRSLLLAGINGLTADTPKAAAATLGLDPTACQSALAALLAEGLIHEPLRLEPGSLHCHWRLELTPSGRHAARTLTGA